SGPAGIINGFVRDKWPLLDVIETPAEVIVLVEIPGLRNAGEVRVELKGGTLKIEGETFPEESLAGEAKVHRQEIRRGKFSRSVTLPAVVDGRGARSTYRRWVLEIILAKKEDRAAEILNVTFSQG
ncbi:MAG: Hsp20/alpha crystallin family protein, partial [Firmicutes bacterium]|nr:Hsp20/alpha crystallin family protein [Bacillota bacterium]